MKIAQTFPNFQTPAPRRLSAAPHAAAIAFYAGLTFLILHTILFTTGTHAAGFDYFNYHWNQWFIRYAFAHPEVNVWFNDFVMFPAVSNYGYHALAAAWYPLWFVLEPLIGTLAAVNVIIALTCFLNGYLTFRWLLAEGVHPAPALIGGAALQIFPISRYFYYNTHLNLMVWWWLPALALLWRQIVIVAWTGPLLRVLIWAVAFGMALWALLLTDLQFPIFAAFLLVPYGLWTAWRTLRLHPAALTRLVPAAALAVIIGAALMWIAGPLPAIAQFTGELEPGAVADRPGIAFPGGLLTMADQWWEWSQPSTGAFIPLAVLAAVIVGIVPGILPRVRDRLPASRWLWLAIALPPLIFALGPTLWIGETALPLPYRWLHALTDGNFRMPWRLAPVFVLAGMAFVGLTVTGLLAAAPRSTVRRAGLVLFPAALLALAISVRLGETAPLTPLPPSSAIYEQIGRETQPPLDRYVVLQAPTAAGTGEVLLGDPRAIQLQWYGIVHQKRMFNGFISRAPVAQFWGMMGDDPLLSWLGGRVPLNYDAVRDRLRERIYGYPIGYLVIHADLIGRESPLVNEIVGFLNQQPDLMCHWLTDGDQIAFRSRTHPYGCPVNFPGTTTITDTSGTTRRSAIDIGGDDAAYLGWGWHYAETVGGVTARWLGADFPANPPDSPRGVLYVDLPADATAITVRAQAYFTDRTLTVTLDGQPIGDPVIVGTGGLGDYTFPLPADRGAIDHAEIALIADAARQPAADGVSTDQRPLAFLIDRVIFHHD